MDDYYAMLGVDADASVDDIRGAYREQKNGIDTTSESGKASAARLNKAWNVLSDPYQRGRYDEQRSAAEEDGTLGESGAEVEVSTNGTGSRAATGNDRRSRSAAAREARVAAQRTPTIALPEGVHFPKQKPRVIAMVIDLLVVLVVFLGVGLYGGNALARHQKPATFDRIDALQKQIDEQNKIRSDADKRVSDDKKANDTTKQQADQKVSDDAKQKAKDISKEQSKEYGKVNGYVLGGIVSAFLLGLLYLAVPSAISGRTLGKKLQHLRVIREDGSPLGWSRAFYRYGVVVLATLVLFLLMRSPLGGVVVLFGVTMWMRNPNMQGLHDRIAHTLVVSDEKA